MRKWKKVIIIAAAVLCAAAIIVLCVGEKKTIRGTGDRAGKGFCRGGEL